MEHKLIVNTLFRTEFTLLVDADDAQPGRWSQGFDQELQLPEFEQRSEGTQRDASADHHAQVPGRHHQQS